MVARMTMNVFLIAAILVQAAQAHDCQMPQRVQRGLSAIDYFHAPPAGFADRWYLRFCRPSFCKMNLCRGSCADPMQVSPAWKEGTPCSLRTFNALIFNSEYNCCQFTQFSQN
jgi:hypothetical protein